MRLKNLFAALAGMVLASALNAQTTALTAGPAAAPVAAPALEPENALHLDLTTGGRVTIQLRPDVAPNHVERIKALARRGFYNGTIFHRVIEGFMAQGGDPTGTGESGSELPDLAAEFSKLPHVRGAVSAARAEDRNSANSQFFIMFAPRLQLDGDYSVFGRVVSGMEYVDAIPRGEPPPAPARIVRASIGSDNVTPPTPAEVAAVAAAPLPRPAVRAPAPAVTSLTPAPAEAPAVQQPATSAPAPVPVTAPGEATPLQPDTETPAEPEPEPETATPPGEDDPTPQ